MHVIFLHKSKKKSRLCNTRNATSITYYDALHVSVSRLHKKRKLKDAELATRHLLQSHHCLNCHIYEEDFSTETPSGHHYTKLATRFSTLLMSLRSICDIVLL